MLTTPGGKSVRSAMIRLMCAAHHGVSGAGLSTTVLPAASAGPSLARLIWCGKLNGVTAPTTPNGSRSRVRRVETPIGVATPRSVLPRVPFGRVGGVREIVDRALQVRSVGERHRCAHFGDRDLPQPRDLGLQGAAQLTQAVHPQRRVAGPVGAVEGRARRADRPVHVGPVAVGRRAQRLLGGRVDGGKATGAAADEFSADQQLGQSGSRATGHDMHRGPPRPVPSSDAAMGSTSMPESARRALVSLLRS